jgi:hypothetical protein
VGDPTKKPTAKPPKASNPDHHDPEFFQVIGQRYVQQPIPAGFPMSLLDEPPTFVCKAPPRDLLRGPFGDPLWAPDTPPAFESCQSLERWAILEPIMLGNQILERVIWKPTVLDIEGTIAAGGPLTPDTVAQINRAAKSVKKEWKSFVAYADVVKVGGSLAWRNNNPGNLRSSSMQIGTFHKMAVFETLAKGREAQKDLYLRVYGSMKVKDAIAKLTPDFENDTKQYLKDLKAQGIDLEKDVKSQIDVLMPAVEKNEGMIAGTEIPRC